MEGEVPSPVCGGTGSAGSTTMLGCHLTPGAASHPLPTQGRGLGGLGCGRERSSPRTVDGSPPGASEGRCVRAHAPRQGWRDATQHATLRASSTSGAAHMAAAEREPEVSRLASAYATPSASHARAKFRAWRPTRRTLLRTAVVLLVVLYVTAWGVSAAFPINPTDLDVFFWPAVRIALAGHPLLVYQVRYEDVYPNANGPLSLVPLTVAAAIAAHFGWLRDAQMRRVVVQVLFASFPLLASVEALRAIDRLRGTPVRGVARLLVYAVFALSPQNWHSVLLYGHIEQPMAIWLVLLGVRQLVEERPARAGACLGLALLCRSGAALFLLPLVLVPARRRRWCAAATVAASATGVVALGLLPFWLADRTDLIYSLVTFRGALPVGGGSVWGLLVGTPLESFAQQWDGESVIVVALLLCGLALLLRVDLDVSSRGMYALLALCGLCFPLLIKTLWPYYFLEPYMLGAVWWLSWRMPSRRWARARWWCGAALPCLAVLAAQIAEQTRPISWNDQVIRLWSAAVGAAMLTLLVALVVALVAGERALARADPLPAAGAVV